MKKNTNRTIFSFLGGAALAGLLAILALTVGVIQIGQTEIHANDDNVTSATMVSLLEQQVSGLKALSTLQVTPTGSSTKNGINETETAQKIIYVQNTLQVIEEESKRISLTATVISGLLKTPTPSKTIPNIILSSTEEAEVRGTKFTYFNISVLNWNEFSPDLFVLSPDLPPCGLNDNSSRTWLEIYNGENNEYIYGFCGFTDPKDMMSFWFAVEKGTLPPKSVYVILNDRRTKEQYISNFLIIR